MSQVSHIIIYTLFFFLLIIFTRISNKLSKKEYIIFIILIIITFSLIEGCRYGRGNDYFWYKYRFEHAGNIGDSQYIFDNIINLSLLTFGFNYIGAYITYSLLFAIGSFYFIYKTFKRYYSQYIYLFWVCATLSAAEYQIRQYVALPFILFAFTAFITNKNIIIKLALSIIGILIAKEIHTGALFIIPFFYIFIFIKKTIPLKLSLPILFIVYYLYHFNNFTPIVDWLSNSNLAQILGYDHIEVYTNNADRWFGEGSYLKTSEQSFFTKSLQYIFETSILILGYKSLQIKPNQNINTFYNITVIGFILSRLFFGYELFTRMSGQLDIYWFITLGYSFIILKNYTKKKIYSLFFICTILYLVAYWFRWIFLNPSAIFIWDKTC